MIDKTRRRFEARARIVKAMAHASRLYILSELSAGERSVGELTEGLGVDMSTVSKHLTRLREAGLVASEKRGNQVYYRVRCSCIDPFFECIESVLRGNGEEARDMALCCRRD